MRRSSWFWLTGALALWALAGLACTRAPSRLVTVRHTRTGSAYQLARLFQLAWVQAHSSRVAHTQSGMTGLQADGLRLVLGR